jgi:hypothetical protein
MDVCIYTYMCVQDSCIITCICIYVCVCVCECMYVYIYISLMIPWAARSKAWACGRVFAGIATSKPAGPWTFVSC